MPKAYKVKIKSIHKVISDVYCVGILSSALAKKALPGQFLHIKLEDKRVLLRRPFSIHKVDKSTVFILFKARGTATDIFSRLKEGAPLNVLGPLGNNFSYAKGIMRRENNSDRGRNIILIAGGIGAAPLVFLAEKIKKMKLDNNLSVSALLGVKTKSEILCESDFKNSGCVVKIATEDGSRGLKGTVTDLLKNQLRAKSRQLRTCVYACGPKAMLRSLSEVLKHFPGVECEASFEQFMGCGIGICCGCAIESKTGYKKVCKDGPVFNLRDIY